jgi:type II secretory pathway component PulF
MSWFVRPFSLKEMVLFCRELCTMEDAGIPTRRAFAVLLDQTRSRSRRAIYADILDRIERGSSLGAALRSQGRAFPPLFVETIAGCETVWAIPEGLQELTRYYETRLEEHRQLVNQLIYPGCVLFAMIFFIPLLRAFLLEMIGRRNEVYNTLLTLRSPAAMVIMFCALSAIGVLDLARRTGGRFFLGYNLFTLRLGQAQFLWCLGLLHARGLPPADCLRYAAKASTVRSIEQRVEGAILLIERGASWQEALGRNRLLSRDGMSMLVAGENAGKLDETFQKTADYIRETTEWRIKVSFGLVEAGFIVLLGLLIVMGYVL